MLGKKVIGEVGFLSWVIVSWDVKVWGGGIIIVLVCIDIVVFVSGRGKFVRGCNNFGVVWVWVVRWWVGGGYIVWVCLNLRSFVFRVRIEGRWGGGGRVF